MLLRQTLLYLPAQVVGPIFQFVSIIVWTHYLAPESMGVFALVMATQELAYTGTLFWFTLYTLRYFDSAGSVASKQQFLDTELAVLIGSGLASVLLVLGLAWFVDAQWTPSLVAASVAHIVTRVAVTHLADRARTQHDTLTYTVLQTMWPVLGLAFGILLVVSVEASATMVLWGYTAAQVLSLAVAGVRLGMGRNPMALDIDVVRIALRYGLPLLAGGLFVWVAINGIRFAVEYKQGAAAVGLITVGWMLGFRAAMFAAMLVTAAAFPLAVRRAREEGIDAGQAQLERNGVLLLVALLPAAVGLWLVSEPLITLVVAETYREMTIAVLPMAILAGVFRNVRLHFAEQIFLLREQTMIPLYNDIFDAVASMAGVVVGLSIGGLPGAAAGAAAGAFVSLLVTLAVGWHKHRYVLPPLDAAKTLAATATMALVVACIPLSPTIGAVALASIAGALVYAAMLALLYPEGRRMAWAVVRR
ncbi:MAG: lipopolysaccharide biosynthesis protein [Hyphomicrobiaceae bacterium]